MSSHTANGAITQQDEIFSDITRDLRPPSNQSDWSAVCTSNSEGSHSNLSFVSNFSVASSIGSFKSNLSRAGSMYRHQALIRNWEHKLHDQDQSLPSLHMTFSHDLGDASQADDLPFYLPFDVYDLLEKDKMDELVVELKSFLDESEHSDQEWAKLLRFNNYELLRVLSTRVDFVTEPHFDTLLECLLLFLDIKPIDSPDNDIGSRYAPPLVTSAFMNRLFFSLQSNEAISLLKRLKVLYILFNFGGLAFPDISFNNCQFLLNLCNYEHRQVAKSALTTSIIGYFRMSSETLWKDLQRVLSFDCIESLVEQCLVILSSKGEEEFDSVHLEASLEWIGSCFCFTPIMYYNIYNIQTTLDIILENLQRFFGLGEEEILCFHIECLKKMIGWKGFFEANYRVDDTMIMLNDLMREAGKQDFRRVCELVSVILNDHLDRLPTEEEFEGDDGDCAVFE